jgi:hypothetical protein
MATSFMRSCVAAELDIRDASRVGLPRVCACCRRRRRRSCAVRTKPVRRQGDARRCRQAWSTAAGSRGRVYSSRGHRTGCSMDGVGGRDGGVSTSRTSWSGLGDAATLTGQMGETTAQALERRGEEGGAARRTSTTKQDTGCCYVPCALCGVVKPWLKLFRFTPTPHLQPVKGPAAGESHVRQQASRAALRFRSLQEPPKLHVETDQVVLLTFALHPLT